MDQVISFEIISGFGHRAIAISGYRTPVAESKGPGGDEQKTVLGRGLL